MKWVALLLLVANCMLWISASQVYSDSTSNRSVDGRLPRVAALEVMKSGSEPEPEPEPEPELGPSVSESVTVAEKAQDVPRMCIELGWFEDKASARRAARLLKVESRVQQIRAVERKEQPFHWIIIPPAPSRSVAYQRFREIQQQGVESYLVTEGRQENAISLGLFESRNAAERVLSLRRAQGMNATLASFPRNRISYALVFSADFPSGPDTMGAQRSGYEERYESVKFSGCEGVATAEKTP